MASWKMLTLVGHDQPGIVASVTEALFKAGCNLGEATMARLGDNFTIMMMVQYEGDSSRLKSILAPVSERLGLQVHADAVEGPAHLAGSEPNMVIRIYGADKAGIVAKATRALMEANANVTNLDTAVGGSGSKPFYIMTIEAWADQDVAVIEEAVRSQLGDEVDINIEAIERMMG